MGPNLTTFSIVGYDPVFSEIGVAVQSKFLAVGSLVSFVDPQTGAVATQAKTNTTLAPFLLHLIKNGHHPLNAIELAGEQDDSIQKRQLGIVDKLGRSESFTGKECLPYAGHITGNNFACQGNCLKGPQVLQEMARAFEYTKGDLEQKLISALRAGQDAGGDIRGQQSAALLIKKESDKLLGKSNKLIDIRVDDHKEPIAELKRLQTLHRVYYSMNYRDRYYPFDQQLVDIIYDFEKSIRPLGGIKPDSSDYSEKIERKVREINPTINLVFSEEKINGEALDIYMNDLYEIEQFQLLKNKS